jgi:hypothetical protein
MRRGQWGVPGPEGGGEQQQHTLGTLLHPPKRHKLLSQPRCRYDLLTSSDRCCTTRGTRSSLL